MGIFLKKVVKKLVGKKTYSFMLNTPLGRKLHDTLHENNTSSRDFLLQCLPKNSVGLEIGVNNGDFSERILELTQPKKLHLIDPWKFFDDDSFISTPYGKNHISNQFEMDNKFENVRKKFSNEISENKVIIHRGFSEEIMPTFENNYFDWVYIDGNHLYDFVKNDLHFCNEKTKDNSLITGDDYYPDSISKDFSKGGVKKAVDEFVDTGAAQFIQLKNNQFIIQKNNELA